jgi:hypothetical protein
MTVRVDGPRLFAQFAYPPNELGYCGPDDARALLEHTASGEDGSALRRLARGFEGAWPYLELIAAENGRPDPLDPDVVEAYWIGNQLLDQVRPPALCRSLEDRFAFRTGRAFERLVAAGPAGAVPHHAFHVFGVYPWVGLLRSGRVDEPLHVLDRCRIRWGQVAETGGDWAVVRSRPLGWDGHQLALGPPRAERVRTGTGGLGLAGGLVAGDWCALHWDWVCAALSPARLTALAHYTARQMDVINRLPFAGPATVLA